VDLLLGLVHKINARAERRVEKELTEDLRRVRGKEGILFRLAEAAVGHPDDTVRATVFPVVGEKTLRELVKEAKANQRVFEEKTRSVLRGSYSNHYRRMLPPLLAALAFRSNNTSYRPVIEALELLVRYAAVDGKTRFYAAGDVVPVDGVVPKAGEPRLLTSAAGSSGSRTSCACWSRSGTRCAAARSMSTARIGGAIPKMTCPATSSTPARCTMPRCGSRSIQPRLSRA
jgi:hypothetical protein